MAPCFYGIVPRGPAATCCPAVARLVILFTHVLLSNVFLGWVTPGPSPNIDKLRVSVRFWVCPCSEWAATFLSPAARGLTPPSAGRGHGGGATNRLSRPDMRKLSVFAERIKVSQGH